MMSAALFLLTLLIFFLSLKRVHLLNTTLTSSNRGCCLVNLLYCCFSAVKHYTVHAPSIGVDQCSVTFDCSCSWPPQCIHMLSPHFHAWQSFPLVLHHVLLLLIMFCTGHHTHTHIALAPAFGHRAETLWHFLLFPHWAQKSPRLGKITACEHHCYLMCLRLPTSFPRAGRHFVFGV